MATFGAVSAPANVAEALIMLLAARGVERIFLNPGTDTAPLQEAIAALIGRGVAVPDVVMCPHEAVALAAAHGYFASSGKCQVVMVHVDVGTQNLGSMMHNAMRGEAGVVIIAGRTPETWHGEEPGGRDTAVHWMQDVPDQAGVVRSYAKWSADLRRASTVGEQVHRAFQVAGTPPYGPVYLTAVRELLMEAVPENYSVLPSARFDVPAAPAPDPQKLREAVNVLARSSRPVIMTGRSGRQPETVGLLVRLAEATGALVIDDRERMNFPSDHPAYCGAAADARAALLAADTVLLVDRPIPWVPADYAPPPSATVISLDIDPIRISMPGWLFPVDLNIHCDPLLGLRALCDAVAGVGPARLPARVSRESGRGEDEQTRDASILQMAEVADALSRVLADDDIVVEEATTNADALRARLRRTVPGTQFRSGGSALGWGVGAALGIKLSAPGRRVVAVVGDGSFLFSSPVAALWSASEHRAPLVVLVLRNGGYAASRRPVFSLFPDGFSAKSGDVIGTLFRDSPDLSLLAEACGACGADVRSRAELEESLSHALTALREGRSTVIVTHVSSPFIGR